MKIILRNITLLLLLISFNNMKAESIISSKQEIQFNSKVWKILNDYEYSSSLDDAEAQRLFKSLFLNEKVLVYNDLLGFSEKESVYVRDYIQWMSSNAKSTMIVLKNVKKRSITEKGNNWIMELECQKSINYLNQCEVYFSSEDYYRADHNIVIEFAMNKTNGQCNIVGIKGNVNSSKPRFGSDYNVVMVKGNNHEDVLYNGSKMDLNTFNQAIMLEKGQFEYIGYEDVKLNVIKGACGITHLNLVPFKWNIKPNISFSIGNSHKFDMSVGGCGKSSTMEFGLDFGYTIPMRNKVKTRIYTGLSLSLSKLDFSVDNLDYNYSASCFADIDGDNYNRYYELSNIKQSVSMMSLMVPLYCDIDYGFSKKFSAYAQIGVKSYWSISSKVDNLKADAYVYGIYPKYDNLLIRDSYINNFGFNKLSMESQYNDKFKDIVSFDAFLGIGFRVNVYGPLLIDCGFKYQGSLTECIKSDEYYIISKGSISEENALISYNVTSGDKAKSLIDACTSVKRRMFSLNVGLILKF